MRNLSIFLMLCIIPCASLFAINGSGSIVSGGANRSFVYHAPGTSVAVNLPLMIVLHGTGNNGAGIESYCGFDTVADNRNFLVVYPNALGGNWNSYINCPITADDPGDDVVFISKLIDYMTATFNIDKSRVYATGHSLGGFMVYHLMIRLPNKIAAFAPVSALLSGNSNFYGSYLSSRGYVKVPIYHIHGDTDPTVTYPDTNNIPDDGGEWPIFRFSNSDCSARTYSSTTDIATNVKKLSFCPGGTNLKEVCLIRIVGGHHDWPAVTVFNAAANIWAFCSQYTLTPYVWSNPACTALSVSGFELRGAIMIVGNQLQWKTITEQQNKGYEVQQSGDGANFTTLAFVKSKADGGNSLFPLNYDFTDSKPADGQNFYRLKQIDFDGNFTFSNTIVLQNSFTGMATISPNPAINVLNLTIRSSMHQSMPITITDAQGKIQITQNAELNAGVNVTPLYIDRLSKGIYILHTDGKTFKFMKQ